MRQALSSTRGGYDLLAPRFDATPFRTPDPLLEQVAAQLSGGPPIDRMIDVCCGTGAVLSHLIPLCEVAVGVDFSPGMLAVARQNLARVKGGSVSLVRGDARALPFRAGFDLATCFGALGHFPPAEQPRFLQSVRRVLRPGGRFVFVTAEPPPPTRSAFWVSHAFNAAIRLRNALIRPPFVMFYLEFSLSQAVAGLVEAGFEPEVRRLGWAARPDLQLVIGHNPA